MFKFIIK